jgi:hypothetical protein
MSKINFKDYTDVDPDVWYHLSEMRVDKYDDNKKFGSQLQIKDDGLRVFPIVDQYWQFQPVDTKERKNRFALRNSSAGPSKQLSVCYVPSDDSNGKTQACMAPSNGLDEQKWDVSDWGDGVLRFINAQNGTDYWLDVHPGSALFMADEIDTSTYQPAQRWVMTSVKNVNDGAFSTTFTNTPTSTTASTSATDAATKSGADDSATTTNSETPAETGTVNGGSSDQSGDKSSDSGSGGGVSSGTAIGVGVGVGLAVVLLALAAFFLWRRKRRGAAGSPPPPEKSNPAWGPPGSSPYQGSVYPVQDPNQPYSPHNYPAQPQQPVKGYYNADSYHSPNASPHPPHGSPHNPHASAYPPPGPPPQELANTTRPPPTEMMA